ncbi:hypothetical protein [Streptomyces sp. NPDC102360]|uniref:hypothetical protein n=1 Tax=Streptomyces sp. NPDC102360 TaxID=3366160 RepID=UPI003810321F
MTWTALVATLVGAAIATGSSLLIEGRRDRRSTATEWRQARRILYGAFLGAMTRARSELYMLSRDDQISGIERLRSARESFAQCYETRYELEVFAPQSVVLPALGYFRAVRRVRDAVAAGQPHDAPEMDALRDAVTATLRVTRDAMRKDMRTDAITTD